MEKDEKLVELLTDYIWQELTLKKARKFSAEKEYRFVHSTSDFDGSTLPTQFVERGLTFNQLGLSLKAINTIDESKVLEYLKMRCLDLLVKRR